MKIWKKSSIETNGNENSIMDVKFKMKWNEIRVNLTLNMYHTACCNTQYTNFHSPSCTGSLRSKYPVYVCTCICVCMWVSVGGCFCVCVCVCVCMCTCVYAFVCEREGVKRDKCQFVLKTWSSKQTNKQTNK